MNRPSVVIVLSAAILASAVAPAQGQLATADLNTGVTATDLVNTLLGAGGGATVSNVTYTGANHAAGTFGGGTGILGFESGIVLSSGNIADVVGPNTSDSTTTTNGTGGDADLQLLIPGYTTFDAAVLEFDFECQSIDVISFQYVFTSEEYNEYVNSPFNNVFGFFLNGINIALLPDGITPVAINNVNGGNPVGVSSSNSAFYIDNDCSDTACAIDIEMDGLTVVLTARGAVQPGVNHIKLAISDAGDSILDSNVFIKAGSFICGLQGDSCFGVNRLKVGTKDIRCKGIELLEVTSEDPVSSERLVGLYVPEAGHTALSSNTTVDDGTVNGAQTIHTSCSQSLEIGDVFGPYTVTDLIKVYDDDPDSRGNQVELRGAFSPSAPVDLAVDDVVFAIGDGNGNAMKVLIPAGSFAADGDPEKQKFRFEGSVGVMEVQARLDFGKCEFRLNVRGVENSNQFVGATLTVTLQVGVNVGVELVAAEDGKNHLKHRKNPEVECCPKCTGIALMEVTSSEGVLVFVPVAGHDELSANTVVDDGVNGPVTIHTSCSKPIEVGDVHGAYTISELVRLYD